MTTLSYHLARRSNPKRLLVALAACIAAFAILGLAQAHLSRYNLQAFDLRDSDLDARLSMTATFTSILVACAAVLALGLKVVDKPSREARWRRAGWVLAALAVEELLGIHGWLQDRGVPWAVCYLPLLAIAAFLLFDARRVLANQSRTRAVFGMGIVAWLAAGALGGLPIDRLQSFGGIEILEMSAGAMFVVALLARCQYLARAYHPVDEVETRPTIEEIARVAIERIDFRKLAVGIALATGVLALQYVLLHRGNYHGSERLPVLDLNNEQTLWSTFQGSLIWVAAGLSLLVGILPSTRRETRRWWFLLGAVLFVLGSDEVIAIHDRFQDVTGHPGQIILTPVALAGVVAWWKVLQELSPGKVHQELSPGKVLQELRVHRLARTLFIAGALLWAYSQASDILLNPSFRWTITPEEVGETTGSTLWVFALLAWLRHRLEPMPEVEIQMLEDELAPMDDELSPLQPVTAGERTPTG